MQPISLFLDSAHLTHSFGALVSSPETSLLLRVDERMLSTPVYNEFCNSLHGYFISSILFIFSLFEIGKCHISNGVLAMHHINLMMVS